MAAACCHTLINAIAFFTIVCGELQKINLQDLAREVESVCVVGLVTVNAPKDKEIIDLLLTVSDIYKNDSAVSVKQISLIENEIPKKWRIELDKDIGELSLSAIMLFRKKNKDRSCLLKSSVQDHPVPVKYEAKASLYNLVSFINEHCVAYRATSGLINNAGLHRNEILANLFTVKDISSLNIRQLYDKASSQSYCDKESNQCFSRQNWNKFYARNLNDHQANTYNLMPKCSRIDASNLSSDEFFHSYVKRSRPIIFVNATRNWVAFSKWTTEFFREKFGNNSVHIKLTPLGDFEGVENINMWENYATDIIPDEVKKQLLFPDLVVVRPAGLNVKFSEFLDIINWAAKQDNRNVSAYLEYSSIVDHLPGLENDVTHFQFAANLLTKRHLNIWLSDGYTLGRLHFDPFDNLLCQLRGKKQVIMFEPFNNSQLYEAHIRQAELSYDRKNHRFRRKNLQDSTSMVMSPIDLMEPDLKRFPKFADAFPLNCTIEEGDVLYMPSFWWHEVYSWPNIAEKRNLAVNFWYEPFLTKEFPCQECEMDVNPHYRHLL